MKMFSSTEIDEILKLPILQQFERQKVEHYDVTLGPDYKLEVAYNYRTGIYITRNSNRAASIEDVEFLVKNWLDAYERKVKEVAAKKKELKKAEIELAAAEYENDI